MNGNRAGLLVVAICVGSAGTTAAQPASIVMVDRDMTVSAGASVTLTAGQVLAGVEDAFIPLRLVDDRGRMRRAANMTYRVLKLYFFDAPQEAWLPVANHELFGHGGRLRELFDGDIGYQLDAPPPYGHGGGATFFEFDREPTIEESLAVSAGGMEANGVAAEALARVVLASGRMQYRDALRYLGFELDTIDYVLSTGDRPTLPGHDVGDFLETYNEWGVANGVRPTTARTLRRRALVGLANPLFAYAIYSVGVSYAWQGSRSFGVPMIRLGTFRYLPIARFRLTPFGTEWAIDNSVIKGGRIVEANLRIGDTPDARTWGIGAHAVPFRTWRRWTVQGGVDIWRQPDMGGAVFATFNHAVPRVALARRTFGVALQGGYKTHGFLPGEPLGAGFVFRAGFAFADVR
jgi:hypothetical protein